MLCFPFDAALAQWVHYYLLCQRYEVQKKVKMHAYPSCIADVHSASSFSLSFLWFDFFSVKYSIVLGAVKRQNRACISKGERCFGYHLTQVLATNLPPGCSDMRISTAAGLVISFASLGKAAFAQMMTELVPEWHCGTSLKSHSPRPETSGTRDWMCLLSSRTKEIWTNSDLFFPILVTHKHPPSFCS